MISHTLRLATVLALLLVLSAPAADADSQTTHVKRGASGQVYTWTAGTC